MQNKHNKHSYLICFLLLILSVPLSLEAALRPERQVLDNGMVLIVMEKHALPMVNVSLSFKAGSIYDPPGMEGLANITNNGLSMGTKKRNLTQISQEIDFVGGMLSNTTGSDFAQLNLKILKKDISVGFDILSDILLNPTFPEN